MVDSAIRELADEMKRAVVQMARAGNLIEIREMTSSDEMHLRPPERSASREYERQNDVAKDQKRYLTSIFFNVVASIACVLSIACLIIIQQMSPQVLHFKFNDK